MEKSQAIEQGLDSEYVRAAISVGNTQGTIVGPEDLTPPTPALKAATLAIYEGLKTQAGLDMERRKG